MEPDADPTRDAWMRRAGPFFPLLVAATGQTRLPLAASLTPSPADVIRAEPWSPLVGALLGLGLGFLAALLAGLGLADVGIAALVASAWLIASGAWAELGVARVLERVFVRGNRGDAGDSGGFALALGLTLSLVISLVLRVALLASISLGAWTGALLVSATVARLAPLVAEHGRSVVLAAKRQGPVPGWPLLIAAAAVVLGLPLAVGVVALAPIAIGLLLAVAVIALRIEAPAAPLILAVELLTLVCFAAAKTYPLFG